MSCSEVQEEEKVEEERVEEEEGKELDEEGVKVVEKRGGRRRWIRRK